MTIGSSKQLISVLAVVLFVGCAKISSTTVCPPDAIGTSFSVTGNNLGTQALAMLGAAGMVGKAGGLMAPNGGTTTPQTTITMSYESLVGFGPEGGTSSCIMPPPPPTVVSTGPPPQILH